MRPTTDPSITTGVEVAVRSILPALEEFLRFENRDLAASEFARWHKTLDEPLPGDGAGAAATLEIMQRVVIPNGLRIGAPGFAGWITTMPTVIPAVAAFAASMAGAQRWFFQSYNFLEYLALEWLKQLLHLDSSYQGTFSSGGSVANLIALGAARQKGCERYGIDPSRDGISRLYKPRVYASNQIHHVIRRAAGVLGLGRCALVELPTDSSFRLRLDALQNQLRLDRAQGYTPIAVVASAGTVNTGAIDPLSDLAEICQQEQLWFHIDGAYGAFGVLDPDLSPLFDGLSKADSVAVDPHKWMAVPVGCGATFVRDREVLRRAFTLEPAAYLEGSANELESIESQFDGLAHTFHDFNVEQSAQSRGVTVWAALKEIGANGMRARIKTHNSFARRLEAYINESPVLEILAPVMLSICCFRYVPVELHGRTEDERPILNALNRKIYKQLLHEHRFTPSSTELNGVFAIRPCYINPRTSSAEVDGLACSVERLGTKVWKEIQESPQRFMLGSKQHQ